MASQVPLEAAAGPADTSAGTSSHTPINFGVRLPDTPDKYLARASAASSVGEYADALVLYREALRYYSPDEVWDDVKLSLSRAFCETFSTLVCKSATELEEVKEYYRDITALYSEAEIIHNHMGTLHESCGDVGEARLCYIRALEDNGDYLAARKNMERVNVGLDCMFISQWHFAMLNDVRRNQAYKNALRTAVQSGGQRVVLDIGAGTGILAMLAKQAGATRVIACEEDDTMCDVAQKCFRRNNMQRSVHLLRMNSTELKAEYLDGRVPLVVTEVFDAGLLGEDVLPTLIDAWRRLLVPPEEGGRVIPGSASLFACLVESDHIWRENQLISPLRFLPRLSTHVTSTVGSSPDRVDYEPYTSEHLKDIGYRALGHPVKFFQIDFNKPAELEKLAAGAKRRLHISATCSGRLDAIATWFKLHLDSENTLSSSPEGGSCWEQAVHPVLLSHVQSSSLQLRPKDKVHIKSHFSETACLLRVTKIVRELEPDRPVPPPLPDTLETIPPVIVDRPTVRYWNNSSFNFRVTRALLKSRPPRLAVLTNTACPIGLQLLEAGAVQHVTYLVETFNSLEVESAIRSLMLRTNIPPSAVSVELSEFCRSEHDALLVSVVEPSGKLRLNLLEDVGIAHQQYLRREGAQVYPSRVQIFGQLIESSTLHRRSQVLSDRLTASVNVKEPVNVFKTFHHEDLLNRTSGNTLLSDPVQLFCLDLSAPPTEADAGRPVEVDRAFAIRHEGNLDAVMYWAEMSYDEETRISTLTGHWHQAAVIPLAERPRLISGQTLSAKLVLLNGSFTFEIV